MARLGSWEISPVICKQSTGPEVLTLMDDGRHQASFHIGGGTSDQARNVAAAFLAIADQLDAQKSADAEFNAKFLAAMAADDRRAA